MLNCFQEYYWDCIVFQSGLNLNQFVTNRNLSCRLREIERDCVPIRIIFTSNCRALNLSHSCHHFQHYEVKRDKVLCEINSIQSVIYNDYIFHSIQRFYFFDLFVEFFSNYSQKIIFLFYSGINFDSISFIRIEFDSGSVEVIIPNIVPAHIEP